MPSSAASLTTGANASAVISWAAVPGADRYRIYRGSSPGQPGRVPRDPERGDVVHVTGVRPALGPHPPTTGTVWTLRNLVEIKNEERVRFDGNVIENVWAAGAVRLCDRAHAAEPGRRLPVGPRAGRHLRQQRDSPRRRGPPCRGLRLAEREPADAADHDAEQRSSRTSAGRGGAATPRSSSSAMPSPASSSTGTRSFTTTARSCTPSARSIFLGFVFTNNVAEHRDYGIMGENGPLGQVLGSILFFPGSTSTTTSSRAGRRRVTPRRTASPRCSSGRRPSQACQGGITGCCRRVRYRAGAGGSVPGADIVVMGAARGQTGGTPAVPRAAAAGRRCG